MTLKLLKRTSVQVEADKDEAFDKELQNSYRETHKSVCDVRWVKVPDTVESIIVHWLSRPGLARLRMPIKDKTGSSYLDPSKTFTETVRAIKRLIAGNAFSSTEFVRKNRKFTVEEIKLAIDRFHLAATSDRHLPSDKKTLKRMNLVTFVYNPYYKDENYKSQFLYYIENEPRPRIEITEEAPPERFPALTVALERHFADFGFASTWRTRNTFVVLSNNLYDFWVEHEKKQLWQYALSPNSISREFFRAVTSWQRRKPEERVIVPSLLLQPWIIGDVFKSHCTMTGILDIIIPMEELDPLDDANYDKLLDEKLDLPEEETVVIPEVMSIADLTEDIFAEDNPISEIEERRSVNRKLAIAEKKRSQYENAFD